MGIEMLRIVMVVLTWVAMALPSHAQTGERNLAWNGWMECFFYPMTCDSAGPNLNDGNISPGVPSTAKLTTAEPMFEQWIGFLSWSDCRKSESPHYIFQCRPQ